jgi:hypothetical protein
VIVGIVGKDVSRCLGAQSLLTWQSRAVNGSAKYFSFKSLYPQAEMKLAPLAKFTSNQALGRW